MSRQSLTDKQLKKRREKVLNAAMKLFEDSNCSDVSSGLEAVSLRSVADAVGCSHTALYRYFPSKEVLLYAMKARAFIWIREVILNAIDPSEPPVLQFEALVQTYIQAATAQPKLYALMFFIFDKVTDAEQPPELAIAKQQALDVCIDVINSGRSTGEFCSEIDPLTVAHMWWIGAHGLVSLHVSGQFVIGRDIEALRTTLITMLRASLGVDAAQVPTRLVA